MESSPVALYVHRSHILKGKRYIPLLYPLLGFLENPNTPWTDAAWKRNGYDSRYFLYVDTIHDADYVVVPHDYHELTSRYPDVFAAIRTEAQKAGKPLLANNTGDTEGPPLPHGIVLRAAGYKSSPRSDTVIVPYPVEDLIEIYENGMHTIRKKKDIPSIGFVGWTHLPLRTRVRTFLKKLRHRPVSLLSFRKTVETTGIYWRDRALRSLSRTKGIRLHVIERDSFGARRDTARNINTWRTEFISNLRDCDYALCVRGDENASFRFYEALAMGRIPLLLDTDCIFPLANDIDYRSFCVIVNHTDIDRIGTILRDFHAQLSPEAFEMMQRRARDVFVKYIRMDSFSAHLARILHDRLSA